MLFYGSLPLAVGVPWGWLALTAPALAIWAYCNAREDRILGETLGESYRARIAGSQRWIPGVW
jgi:protein-S-isoprenylcysteine O-methyltransferase Ste14